MAVMLSELLSEHKSQFKLTLLAGAQSLEVPVNWVHLVEDAAVAPYFWGGELVVTTGVGQSGERWLLELVQGLLSCQISGVIVNTGMYIQQIPREVIDFCDQAGLALMAMPWEIHLSDVIKTFCMRIVMGSRDDAAVSRALAHAIREPQDEAGYLPALLDYYEVDGVFQVMAFRLYFPENAPGSARIRTSDALRTLLSRAVRRFSLFRHEDFYLLVLNGEDDRAAQEVARQLLDRCGVHQPPLPIYIGVGVQVTGVQQLAYSYRRARSAARMADYFQRPLVWYRDMGIYQLLFAAEDRDVLAHFYRDCLGPLEDYDKTHNSCLMDTLYHFLRTGGSVKAMAEAMYTHRNTINYRISKLRELLGSDLSDPDLRTRYRMAFYARDITQRGRDRRRIALPQL